MTIAIIIIIIMIMIIIIIYLSINIPGCYPPKMGSQDKAYIIIIKITIII